MTSQRFPSRRRDYVAQYPNWMRLGDGVAEAIVAAILAFGFLSYGYVEGFRLRSLAYFGCALLGCWALAGLMLGRWSGPLQRTSRRVLAVGGFFLFWTALQIVPLPSGIAATLSGAWGETREAFGAAGLEFPARTALAHSPLLAVESWHQAFASLLFFAAVLMLAARRSCAIRLMVMVCVVSTIEGLWGAWSFFFVGQHRAHGLGAYNPNHHAALVLAGLPLLFAGVLQWSRLSARFTGSLWSGSNPLVVLYGLGALAGLGWLAGLSRSSLLLGGTVVAGWALYEFVAARREHEREPLPFGVKVVGATGIGVLLLAGALLLESTHLPQELAARTEAESRWVDRGRLDFARATLAGAAEAPWTGLGLRGANHAMTRHASQPTLLTPIWTHNDPVQLLAEIGFVAGAILLGLAIWAAASFREDLRDRARIFDWSEGLLQRAAAAGVLATALHSLTDFHLRVPLVGFTVLILLALVLRQGPMLVPAFAKR